MSRRLALLLATVCGCVPPLVLPDDAIVACAASADCPAGVCVVEDVDVGGRCVVDKGVCFDDGDPAAALDDGASCGDGAVCRDGVCVVPGCGDGVVDVGEDCDDGAANSDAAADACRADCTAARCGDGVVDSDEECEGDVEGAVCDACAVVCDTGRGDCDLDVGNGCECALEELFVLDDDTAPAIQPEGVLDGDLVLLQHQRFTVERFALRAGALVALDAAEQARFAARDDVHAVDGGGRVEARADGRGAIAVFVDDDGAEREIVRSDDAPLPIALAGRDVWIAVFRSDTGSTLERYSVDVDAPPDVVVELTGFPTILRADDDAVCAFGLKPEALMCRTTAGDIVFVDEAPRPVFALMSPSSPGTPVWADAAGAVCALDDDGVRVVRARRADGQALLAFAGASVDGAAVDVVTAGLVVDDDASAADVAAAAARLPAGAMVPVPGKAHLRMLARGGLRGSVVVDANEAFGGVVVSDGRTVWRAPLP